MFMTNKKAGRPTVITIEAVSKLVASFQNGMTVRDACWQSGISHEAYYNRLRNDEEFADTMARAQASCTLKARQVIIEAIQGGSVSTAKWWLEKKAPDEFGRNPTQDIESSISSPDESIANMSDAELQKLTEELYYILQNNQRNVTDDK